MKRILIVGGVAGGASAAARLRAGYLEGGRDFRDQVAEGAGVWLERFMATSAFAEGLDTKRLTPK